MKPCTCCGKSAPEVEFGRGQTGRQRSWCRTCEREANTISMRHARERKREIALAEERVRQAIDALVLAAAELKRLKEARR